MHPLVAQLKSSLQSTLSDVQARALRQLGRCRHCDFRLAQQRTRGVQLR